jgi:hypothetical protein
MWEMCWAEETAYTEGESRLPLTCLIQMGAGGEGEGNLCIPTNEYSKES